MPRTAAASSSPAAAPSPSAAAAPSPPSSPTPAEAQDSVSGFRPTAIFECVGYEAEGSRPLSAAMHSVVRFIRDVFVIPPDFESNSYKYGPLSGMCFEDRLVTAYTAGKLQPKAPGDARAGVKMCKLCAKPGHFYFECSAAM